MLRFLPILLMVVLQLGTIKSEEPLYPDVSCHPSYMKTSDEETGEGWIAYTMNICKESNNSSYSCYKACIIKNHGILTKDDPTPDVMHQMRTESDMFRFMFDDEQIRSQIAKRITSECSEKLKEANEKKIPCDDRDEFYQCVENAWKC